MNNPTADLRLGIFGPVPAGSQSGVESQGKILGSQFIQDGYQVRTASPHLSRIRRTVDTAQSIISWRNEMDLAIVMVFSGLSFGFADLSSFLLSIFNVPIIFWLHGGNLPNFAVKHSSWTQKVLRRGQAFVAPSNYLAKFLSSWGHSPLIIPNVLNIDEYPFRRRKQILPKLFWMRSFHPIYHPEMAVKVLTRLKSQYPEVSLTMAGGDKGLFDRTKQFAEEEQILEHIRFAGYLDKRGKSSEFRKHEIFLNTTRVDNTPVSLLEAAAVGLPIVSTNVGGIPDLLRHGETGLLVDNEDDLAMTMAVTQLIERPDLTDRLSVNGRQLAERSSWANVKPQWEAVFRKIVANAY